MHPILLLFYGLMFLAGLILMILFITHNYRQWKKSRDFGRAIEAPKYDYVARELGEELEEKKPESK
jgi:hypothetical protein